MAKKPYKRVAIASATAGLALPYAAAHALTANFSTPVREDIVYNPPSNNQPQLTVNVCHGGPCNQTTGSDSNNWWSVDLFDGAQGTNSPILATRSGVVQSISNRNNGVNGNGNPATGIRYGSAGSTNVYGYYNGHGVSGSIPAKFITGAAVAPGEVIMKMGSTGTNTHHLHFEIRFLANVGTWNSSFSGYCGKQYINRIKQNLITTLTRAYSSSNNTVYDNCYGTTT